MHTHKGSESSLGPIYETGRQESIHQIEFIAHPGETWEQKYFHHICRMYI